MRTGQDSRGEHVLKRDVLDVAHEAALESCVHGKQIGPSTWHYWTVLFHGGKLLKP